MRPSCIGSREAYTTVQQVQVPSLQVKPESPTPTPNPQPLSEAEACFLKAIEIARKQQAKSLELRAAMSLARLWQQQGKTAKTPADAGGDLRLVHRRV